MDLPALLHQYGYVLIFLGTLVEGETLLMLGGYFAHQGYLELGPLIVIAFVGAVCGDQLFFYIGRHHAKRLLGRFPKLRDKVNVALLRIERHQIKIVLGMRFFWGLRIALPIALGLSSIATRRFLWLNLSSAAVWSCAFAILGFGAGKLVQQLEADLRRHEIWIAAVFVLAAVAALIWHSGRPRRVTKAETDSPVTPPDQ
jgi:membrane protein DedA with SNARE-associated domain